MRVYANLKFETYRWQVTSKFAFDANCII